MYICCVLDGNTHIFTTTQREGPYQIKVCSTNSVQNKFQNYQPCFCSAFSNLSKNGRNQILWYKKFPFPLNWCRTRVGQYRPTAECLQTAVNWHINIRADIKPISLD